MSTLTSPAWALHPAAPSDVERIAELRAVVMRPDLERLGRYDEHRVRRGARDTFAPEHTSVVLADGEFAGCVTLRPVESGWWLESFYLSPALQGRGNQYSRPAHPAGANRRRRGGRPPPRPAGQPGTTALRAPRVHAGGRGPHRRPSGAPRRRVAARDDRRAPVHRLRGGPGPFLVLVRSNQVRQSRNYLMILVTWPAPTVRPPSRMANFRPSSMATGWISATVMSVLSPGMTISVPSGRVTTPVTSVVRK